VKIVVTGASGFIGRNALGALSKRNHDVLSVSSRDNTEQAFPDGDVCIHLAANSVIEKVQNFEDEWARTKTLLKRIEERGFGTVVFASSGAIYGDQSLEPRVESEVVSPQNAYSKIKRLAEIELLESSQFKNVVCLRLANIIGRGMNPQSVVVDVLTQSDQSQIKLRNKTSLRDYTHVSDIVAILEKVILKPQTGIFNVGSGQSHSVEQIVKTVESIKSKTFTIQETAPLAQLSCIRLDVSKVSREFGWKTQVSLKASLQEMISI
jgi:UDP-glucose 4-epimerase